MGRDHLTRDQVLDAAMDLVETSGANGLSMRSLAAKLGVAPTAIYWHVGNKEALRDALVDLIAPKVFKVRTSGRDPEARVLSTARSLLRALDAHPHLAGLAYERGRLLELLTPARHALAEAFMAAGLEGTAAVAATNAVVQLVGDRATTRYNTAGVMEQRLDTEAVRRSGSLTDPRLERQLGTVPNADATFEVSLRAMVRGLLRA